MHGFLFTVFEGTPLAYPISTYFILVVMGIILGAAVTVLGAHRLGHDADVIVDLGIAMFIAGLVGAKLFHVLADGYLQDYVNLCLDPSKVDWRTVTQSECTSPEYQGVWDAARRVCHPAKADCFRWANLLAGGYTFYGGFIAAAAVAYWQLRRDRFPFWRAADLASIAVGLGLGVGRIGCLLAGCCFGCVSHSSLAVRFPSHSPASEAQFRDGLLGSPLDLSLPVQPTQLYEAAGAIAITLVLILWLHARKRYDGQVFLAFVGLYAVLRFLIETVRADDRGGLLWLSTSQWVAMVSCAAAIWGHRVLLRLAVPSPGKPGTPPGPA